MARQLLFTSVPRGLTPGRTGYCTVARHRDLRDRLVSYLEGLSVYPSGWQPPPVVCSFRLLNLSGTVFPVLTRIVDAGQDYTNRSIFLAHHLVLDAAEISGAPSPAEVFLRWPGWRQRWDEPPRWLEDADLVDLRNLPPLGQPTLPAQTWGALTSDAGRAALLLDGAKPCSSRLGCDIACENYLLALFCESSALLSPADAWQTEFTTCLQFSDTLKLYTWAAVRQGSPVEAPAMLSDDFLDLTKPDSLPPAPNTSAAELARFGRLAPPPAPAPAPAPNLVLINPVEKTGQPILAKPIATPPTRHNPQLAATLAALLLAIFILFTVLSPRFRAAFESTPEPTSSPATSLPSKSSTDKPALIATTPPASSSTSTSITVQKSVARTLILPPTPAKPRMRPPVSNIPSHPVTSTASTGPAAFKPGEDMLMQLPNNVSLSLLWIRPGKFIMGSPTTEPRRYPDEGPQTVVTLSKGFWLGKFPVTQQQWAAVMGNNPSYTRHRGANNPVDNVSWDSAMEFCRRLTDRERAAGRLPAGYAFTLPTEAQWEYAARAGATNAEPDELTNAAWYIANSQSTSHSVGLKTANAFGLYDIHGNIAEWCFDWYDVSYPGGTVTDPTGPATGNRHVARGGNYVSQASDLRYARRLVHPQNYHNVGVGFRLALAPIRPAP